MISSLKPEKTTNKVLISSTSGFGNEYINDQIGIMITHAWDQGKELSRRRTSGPAFRTAYIVTFSSQPNLLQNSFIGETICSYLSVLFGKRFDNHGLVESVGEFWIPNLSAYYQLCNPDIPQNSLISRRNFQIPLDLSEICHIENIFKFGSQERILKTFNASAKFYMNALSNFENDAEIAFFHLITAGEILANFYKFDNVSLLEEEIINILDEISIRLPEGEKKKKTISSKLFQVKRRFVKTICNLVNDDFFLSTEGIQDSPLIRFQKEDFNNRIGAAYDLRSKYVHTGFQFASIVSDSLSDLHIVKYNLHNTELNKAINSSPTYFGLERTIRYCLLRFAQDNGIYMDN